jgi:hypothetical protein
MTNEDLERAREFAHHKLAESVNPLGIDDPDRWVTWLAEFRADGEREVFERMLEALDAMVRNRSDITVPKVVYMAIDYLNAAFPEYARTEEPKS